MPVHIAEAVSADIPALSDLLSLLFAQEAEFTPDPAAQRRGLQAIIGDPSLGTLVVARREGVIIGMVNLLYTVSTALGGRVALLEDLIVAPDARAAGVGSLLIERAIGIARDNGCARITLLTDGDNQTAHRFYRKHGFIQSSMIPFRLVPGG